MADLISSGMTGNYPNPTRAASWTSPNGLTTSGVINPFHLTQNDPSMGYMGASPPQQPAPPPAPYDYSHMLGTPPQQPQTQAPAPPVQPALQPGQTDPMGDARRLAAYQGAGWQQNAQGGWEPPQGLQGGGDGFAAPWISSHPQGPDLVSRNMRRMQSPAPVSSPWQTAPPVAPAYDAAQEFGAGAPKAGRNKGVRP